jgi:hypothetical protein
MGDPHRSDGLRQGDETMPVNREWRRWQELLIVAVFGACRRRGGARRCSRIDR